MQFKPKKYDLPFVAPIGPFYDQLKFCDQLFAIFYFKIFLQIGGQSLTTIDSRPHQFLTSFRDQILNRLI